ncbi:PLP-dependent aminotransferase family protein [Actinokineospora sp. 24-640]
MRYAARMARVGPSAIRDLLRHGADPGIISFGGGYPDPALFPMADLRAVYDELLAGDPANLQYCPSNGLPSLRAHVADRLGRDGIGCDADDVLVIQGAQQGLDLAGKLVLDPGDTVVTETPTFLGALIAFNPFEPTYAPVRTDEDGMDPADLERVLRGSPRAKLLYTVPDFQNPTGVTMSLERRHQVIDLANRFDLLVVEDTPYRALRYDGDQLPTLKSLDTEGRVLHLGTFSKILAPGVRLGWAVAPQEMLDKLTLLKLAADTQCGTLSMAAVSLYLDRFDIDAHIAAVRDAYRDKRDLMLTTLRNTFPASTAFTVPSGGLFTWLSFPGDFDTTAFLRDVALPRARVAYVPGASFFPLAPEHNHARLNFSGVPDGKIVDGLTRLGALLR